MKLHRHMLDPLAQSLVEVFAQNQPAEKVLERILKSQRKWGGRDRRFFAENFYSCVRWWRKLWFCLEEPEPNEVTPENALRAWACHWVLSGEEWPDLPAAKIFERQRILQTDADLLAIRESIPDWLNEWGARDRGERWPGILKSLNEVAPVDLRVNTDKITVQRLQDQLRQEDILTERIHSVDAGLSLMERKNIFSSECFQKGFFEIQDRGSQQIAPLLGAQSGGLVIDACAGAGGKSLHLANLMQNKGKIIAMDIHEWKLKELQTRATRQGVNMIETRRISADSLQELESKADALLLDVPCSGTGVIRRHPDSKWKLSRTEVDSLVQTQARILREYSKMLKPGGLLLYATCSVMNSENQEQIRKFLLAESTWKLLSEHQLDPDQQRGDGFFAALLQRP